MAKQLDFFSESHLKWKEEVKQLSKRNVAFETLSGEPLETCYFPENPEKKYNMDPKI